MTDTFLDSASKELTLLTCKNPASKLFNRDGVTGWGLGPSAALLQCLQLNSPLHELQNRKKLGLKITVCLCSWGKLWSKDTKRPKKPNCHFWRARSKNRELVAKAGYCACPLHTTPPKGWTNDPSHPSGQTPGYIPTLIPYKEQACPHFGKWASKGTCYLFLPPPATARAPVKPCLNFVSGLWSISI